MIVDIGGGTTEVAVICLAGIVYRKSVRIAGDEMDEAIMEYVKKYPQEADSRMIDVKGLDLVDQLPKNILVSAKEIRSALQEPLRTIVNAVRTDFEQAPPEVAADIIETGIILTGDGALLPGIDCLLRQEMQLPVTVADNAIECAALGAGKVLDELDLLARVTVAA